MNRNFIGGEWVGGAGGDMVRRNENPSDVSDIVGVYAQADAADASAQMRIAREEIFGPVACAIVADDFDHAMSLANDSPYGLSAGICTSSLQKASYFRRRMKSGMVMVNVPTAGVDYHVPFGGTKGSSYGSREQGAHAIEFYTTIKTAYTRAA